jgi:hypothetical protein
MGVRAANPTIETRRTMDCKYNGWTNYETWAVSLWLGNDRETDAYWRGVAREVFENAGPGHALTREEVARVDLATRLKDEIEENMPCPNSGLYTDLLNAALAEVNWYEIADALLEDVTLDEASEPIG